MDNKEIIVKLEEFRSLMKRLSDGDYTESNFSELRTSINRKKPLVQKIIRKAGTGKLMDISPPPLIGGFVMNGVDPFSILFNAPFGIDIPTIIIDTLDQTIGYIESNQEFNLLENKKRNQSKIKIVKSSKKVFLVHGHDNGLKEKVARFLERVGLQPIILHEQANEGLTIIEKFEKHSDVHFSIILMTPDDVGNSIKQKKDLNYRARQNVVLELGYFLAKLGRKNVCALVKDNIELPTDYKGVVYIAVDPADGWKLLLTKELKTAELDFDSNKVFE